MLFLVHADKDATTHAAQDEDDSHDHERAHSTNLPTDAVAAVATEAYVRTGGTTFWRTDLASVCDALARACPPAMCDRKR